MRLEMLVLVQALEEGSLGLLFFQVRNLAVIVIRGRQVSNCNEIIRTFFVTNLFLIIYDIKL
jgi:hypothetical protein